MHYWLVLHPPFGGSIHLNEEHLNTEKPLTNSRHELSHAQRHARLCIAVPTQICKADGASKVAALAIMHAR